jgi:hypothetical protein
MSSVKDIEYAIEKLSKDELAAFREWFEEFDARAWDRQFEEDVALGRLDRIAEHAIAEFKAGKCKEI